MNKALGYERLRRHGRAFRRLTGVTPAVFEEIIERVRLAWLKRERSKKKSGRPHGMGGLEEQLMGLLIYYRFYTTHLFIGSLFGVDDPPSAGASPFSSPSSPGPSPSRRTAPGARTIWRPCSSTPPSSPSSAPCASSAGSTPARRSAIP